MLPIEFRTSSGYFVWKRMRYVSDSTLYKCAEAALYLAKIQIMLKKVLVSYLSIIPDFYGAAQNRKTNK